MKKRNWGNYEYSKIIGIPEVIIRANLLNSRLRKVNRNVLEIGVGTGEITKILLKKFAKIKCIDSNEKNLKNLERIINEKDLNRIEFVHSKIEEVNLKEKYKDIILFGILEHLKNPLDVLNKVNNYLKKDGKVYIIVPLANSLHRLLGVKMGIISNTQQLSESDISLGHYRVYTKEMLKKQLKKTKFKIDYEQSFYLKPLPTSMTSHLPLEIHKGLDLLGREYPELASYTYLEVKKLKN